MRIVLQGILPEDQKIIYKGKTLADPGLILSSLSLGSPATTTVKLVLVGTSREELEKAEEVRSKIRVRVMNDLTGAGSRGGAGGGRGATRSRHGFQSIEVLPNLPDQDKARKILEELATDPGVIHVMQRYNWTVGALCELFPEGYVGVSDVCVMGLNQNKG